MLLKWLNYQVQRVAPDAKEATNFGSALKDCTLYSHLLSAVAPAEMTHLVANLPKAVAIEKDPIARAQLIIDCASQLGIAQFVRDRCIGLATFASHCLCSLLWHDATSANVPCSLSGERRR